MTAVDDCRKCALPNDKEIEATRAEDEVVDSDADHDPVQASAFTPTRESPPLCDLPQAPSPPSLAPSEHADLVIPTAWANDISQGQMHIPFYPPSHGRTPSPPASTPKNLPPVATSGELAPQNARPRTTGNGADNGLPATRNPTSKGNLAHGVLTPSMQSLVSLPIDDQEPSSSTLTSYSASNAVGQIQTKRGLSDEVGIRGSKRRRVSLQESVLVEKESSTEVSTSTSRSTRRKKGAVPQVPSLSATSWFSEFQKMFMEKDLGMAWKDLVSSWVAFEEQSRSTQVRRLSAAGRPVVVHRWIARHRPTNFQSNISNLKDYKSEFIHWWSGLQPTWRISNNGDKDGDWGCLRVPGINGIMNVVVALFYWGLASEGKSAHHNAWQAAVEDCVTVFSSL